MNVTRIIRSISRNRPSGRPFRCPGIAGRLVLLGVVLATADAAEWPTYQADPSRSAVSQTTVPAPLDEAWQWTSPHRPRPAWGGEAKADLYNKVYDMPHRQDFDHAFQVAVADGCLVFGSSADDKVYCLDAGTGRERWTFFTEGPVRLAPTLHAGRVLVGSDDGFVYCLQLADGAVVWKHRPGPDDTRIPGNGRVISPWPVRTGVLVLDGIAYCGAGMFPSEGVYLCALDAATGEERWKVVNHDLPAQGYLLASATRLYVPSGRNNPVVYDRADGSRIRVVDGAGGTYALLTGDDLVFGPGKAGQLGVVPGESADQLATFAGNHMIVTPSRSFLHADDELSALDRARYLELARERKAALAQRDQWRKELERATKAANTAAQERVRAALVEVGATLDRVSREMSDCLLWRSECRHPLSLILAGDVLYAGGGGSVAAYSTADGARIWSAPVHGNALGLAAAEGRLFVSTDAGGIHCFSAKATVASAR
jgi:outer membrane protein assembly factor BamB